ncbi:MAG: shikimate kinase [Planctomycetota bacterium]|nr:shikimate kinase [Planctomycetota bacterium]
MSTEKNLYLTGYRGTGKSTVGRRLAERLQTQCIDLDDVVEAVAGKSIREIFEQGGEESFRDFESSALVEVSSQDGVVISLGGGAILRPENRKRISSRGFCFWLDAQPETILKRLRGDASSEQRRPALTDLTELEEIRAMLTSRQKFYSEVSSYRINVTDRGIGDITEEILSRWEELKDSGVEG